jgi:hypothetical protein
MEFLILLGFVFAAPLLFTAARGAAMVVIWVFASYLPRALASWGALAFVVGGAYAYAAAGQLEEQPLKDQLDELTQVRRSLQSNAAPGNEFRLDIEGLLPVLSSLSSSEASDQLRDWVALSSLLHLGFDDEQLTDATRHLPPRRLPYLENGADLQFGSGRIVLIGDEMLLFIDADLNDATPVIGRLADQARMELGRIPDRARVFSFQTLLDSAEVSVREQSPIAGTRLFEGEFGYVHATVQDTAGLAEFLSRADDLTFARVRADGHVDLGGRRFEHQRTRGVRIEDVAVLFRAQRQLMRDADATERAKNALIRKYEQRLTLDHSLSFEAIRHELEREIVALPRGPAAPGFSLDPAWRVPGLVEGLQSFADDPCRDAFASADELALERLAVSFGLSLDEASAESCADARERWGGTLRGVAAAAALATDVRTREAALGPLLNLEVQVRRRTDGAERLMSSRLTRLFRRQRVQCARYDGPLQGTRVGVNLFYTDLLAKLWESIDYESSVPTRHVPGFLSTPRMNLPAEWLEEQLAKPSTRIWFGLRNDRYSAEGDEISFAHIATRVFAQGSSGGYEAEESDPAEGSRRSLGWWDANYARVADYEQEYHFLNQVQKWSLVAASMVTRDALASLVEVPFEDGYRYDQWVDQQRSQLRFQTRLPLRSPADSPTGTECIDILSSRPFLSSGSVFRVEGGVSLAGRSSLAQSAGRRVALIDPSHAHWKPTRTPHSSLGEVRTAEFKASVRSSAGGQRSVTVTSSKGSVGEFTLSHRAGKNIPEWTPRDVARAVDVAEAAAQDALSAQQRLRPGEVLATLDDGSTLVRVPEGFLHSTHEGISGETLVEIASATSPLRTARLSPSNVSDVLASRQWHRLEVTVEGKGLDVPGGVHHAFSKAGPSAPGKTVTLRGFGEQPVPATVMDDGSVWIRRHAGKTDVQREFAITAREVEAIGAAPANATLDASTFGAFDSEALVSALSRNRSGSKLSRLLEAAGKEPALVRHRFEQGKSRLLAEAQLAERRQQFAEANRFRRLAGQSTSGEARAARMRELLNSMPSDAAEPVLRSWGFEHVPALRVKRPLPGRTLRMTERAHLEEDAVYYIEDGFALNRQDLTMAPDGLLAELSRAPDVRFDEVLASDLGSIAQQRALVVGDKTYHELKRSAEVVARAYFIQRCPDNDQQCAR